MPPPIINIVLPYKTPILIIIPYYLLDTLWRKMEMCIECSVYLNWNLQTIMLHFTLTIIFGRRIEVGWLTSPLYISNTTLQSVCLLLLLLSLMRRELSSLEYSVSHSTQTECLLWANVCIWMDPYDVHPLFIFFHLIVYWLNPIRFGLSALSFL